jgi:invasion protein IalB
MLRVIEPKQRQVVLVWLIGRDDRGVLRTVIQNLPGVQIPQGVALRFGNGPARTLHYTTCTIKLCEASIPMDEAMIQDAKASTEATATVHSDAGRPINFTMGIKGIDRALASLGK